MHTVDRDDLHRAYRRWCEYYGHQPVYPIRKDYCRLCGTTQTKINTEWAWVDYYGGSKQVHVPEKTYIMTNLMLSPHWQTLLKAMEIRNAEEAHNQLSETA